MIDKNISDQSPTNIGTAAAPGGFSLSDLVDDLQPVKPLRIRDGMAMAVTLTLFIGVGIAFFLGLGSGLTSGRAETITVLRLVALLGLGVAAGYAAMSMARPAVGSANRSFEERSWKIALGLAAIFPIAGLISFGLNVPQSANQVTEIFNPTIGRECLTYSSISALMIGAGIVTWLRRGAVTAPERAGWLVGLAAGGFGAAAYSIYCPNNDVVYIGTWYTLAVGLCAVAGRLTVPRLLRW